MTSHVVKVSSKGQLVIPAEVRASMRIKPGMRLRLLQRERQIVLQPVSDLIEELHGITAGRGSGTEMLLKQRREDDRRRAAKLAKW